MKLNRQGLLLIFFLYFLIGSCEKQEKVDMGTLKFLYREYNHGEIVQALFQKKIVFVVSLNMWDAPVLIYGNNGAFLGECYWAWGPVDPICEKLTNSEVIYRCENHINGQPPIDKYNLANL